MVSYLLWNYSFIETDDLIFRFKVVSRKNDILLKYLLIKSKMMCNPITILHLNNDLTKNLS